MDRSHYLSISPPLHLHKGRPLKIILIIFVKCLSLSQCFSATRIIRYICMICPYALWFSALFRNKCFKMENVWYCHLWFVFFLILLLFCGLTFPHIFRQLFFLTVFIRCPWQLLHGVSSFENFWSCWRETGALARQDNQTWVWYKGFSLVSERRNGKSEKVKI